MPSRKSSYTYIHIYKERKREREKLAFNFLKWLYFFLVLNMKDITESDIVMKNYY